VIHDTRFEANQVRALRVTAGGECGGGAIVQRGWRLEIHNCVFAMVELFSLVLVLLTASLTAKVYGSTFDSNSAGAGARSMLVAMKQRTWMPVFAHT
jgi:hypothetical protein